MAKLIVLRVARCSVFIKLNLVSVGHGELAAYSLSSLSTPNQNKTMRYIGKLPVLLGAGVLVLITAIDAAADGRDSGKIYKSSCAVCHGDKGEGKTIGKNKFPAIAGLQKWYVQDQLIKFKYDGRGADYRDKEGLMMHAMVRTLKTGKSGEMEIEGVAEFVSNLAVDTSSKADRVSASELAASIERGREIYKAEAPRGCELCHGDKFQGTNKEDVTKLQPRAPTLSPLEDWYMLRQLKKFRHGIRGGAADTKRAQQLLGEAKAKLKIKDKLDGPALMQAMSQTALPDEQAVKDVVAFIYSQTHPSK